MDNYLSAYVYLMLKDCQSFYRNVKSLNRVRDTNICTRKYQHNHNKYYGVYFVSEKKPIPHPRIKYIQKLQMVR